MLKRGTSSAVLKLAVLLHCYQRVKFVVCVSVENKKVLCYFLVTVWLYFTLLKSFFYDKHLKIKCFLHNVGDAISNKT